MLMTAQTPPDVRRVPPAGPSRYRGRVAALATKHAKERALAWPLGRGLGLSLRVPAGMDTDMLGTFTGEIPREGTPAEVVRRKARLGITAAKLPIGMASEGSFGPHPLMPLLPSDFEVLVFVDDEEGFAVSQEVVTAETFGNSANRSLKVRGIDTLCREMPQDQADTLCCRNLADRTPTRRLRWMPARIQSRSQSETRPLPIDDKVGGIHPPEVRIAGPLIKR